MFDVTVRSREFPSVDHFIFVLGDWSDFFDIRQEFADDHIGGYRSCALEDGRCIVVEADIHFLSHKNRSVIDFFVETIDCDGGLGESLGGNREIIDRKWMLYFFDNFAGCSYFFTTGKS